MTKRLTRHDAAKLASMEKALASALRDALDLIAARPDIAGKISDALGDVRFVREKHGEKG